MSYLLIDYENVGGKGITGITNAFGKGDKIILFYSAKASKINIDIHQELEKSDAKKLYIKTEAGTQSALDFQLCSYLGACIHNDPEDTFYVLSRDCDYDSVVHFWQKMNIDVKRIEHLRYYAQISK